LALNVGESCPADSRGRRAISSTFDDVTRGGLEKVVSREHETYDVAGGDAELP